MSLFETTDFELAPGARFTFPQPSDFLLVLETTGQLVVRFNDKPGGVVEAGIKYRRPNNDTIRKMVFTNKTDQTVYCKFGYGFGDVTDNRFITVDGTRIEKPDTVDDLPDVTVNADEVTTIAAVDASREAIDITILSGGECRLGGDNVSASRGMPLTVGESRTIETTGAVKAYSETGCTLAIGVTKHS